MLNVVVGTVLPTFTYNGKVRANVVVEKVIETRSQFLGKLSDGQYRTFDIKKIVS